MSEDPTQEVVFRTKRWLELLKHDLGKLITTTNAILLLVFLLLLILILVLLLLVLLLIFVSLAIERC